MIESSHGKLGMLYISADLDPRLICALSDYKSVDLAIRPSPYS